MGLETGTKIKELQAHQPLGSDQVSEGDDHIRLIKTVLTSSFPADIEKQVPDIIGHGGKHLAVAEDELSTEWAEAQDISRFFSYRKLDVQIFGSRVWEKITYDLSLTDAGTIADPLVGQWIDNEWVIEVVGLYWISGCFRVKSDGIWDHDLAIKLNGTQIKQLSYTSYGVSSNFQSLNIDTVFHGQPGDVVTIEAFTESYLEINGGANALGTLVGYRIA